MRSPGKLLRSFGTAIGIKLAAAIVSYGSFVLLTRWLPADEFGKLAFGFSLAMVVGIVGGGGQRQLVLRFLGAYQGTERPDLARGLIRYSGRMTLLAAVGALVGLGGAAAYLGPDYSYLWPAAALAAALILSEYLSFALRGLDFLTWALLPKHVLWRPIALIGVVLVGVDVLQTANAGLWWLAGALWLITIIQFVALFRPATRFETSGIIKGDATGTASEADVWTPAVRKFWATASLGPSFQHLTVVVMGFALTDIQTGIYFAILRTAGTLTFLLQAVNMVVAPRIAKAHAKSEPKAIQRLVSLSAVLALAVGVLGFVVFMIWGGAILSLFDPDYAAYQPELLVMAAGFLISAACGSSAQLLNMTGREGANLMILLTTNIAALILMYALAGPMGIMGAATGFALGLAARNIAAAGYARRTLAIDSSILGVVAPPKGSST